MLRISRQAALLCALAAAAAVLQSCDAARARPAAKVKPRASKSPHRSPIRPGKPKAASKKPTVGRKVRPAASQQRVAAAAQLATVEQVTIRRCGTPPVNQTMREAVQTVLQPRIDQLAHSRAAPVTVRVYFHFVQARPRRAPLPSRRVTAMSVLAAVLSHCVHALHDASCGA